MQQRCFAPAQLRLNTQWLYCSCCMNRDGLETVPAVSSRTSSATDSWTPLKWSTWYSCLSTLFFLG